MNNYKKIKIKHELDHLIVFGLLLIGTICMFLFLELLPRKNTYMWNDIDWSKEIVGIYAKDINVRLLDSYAITNVNNDPESGYFIRFPDGSVGTLTFNQSILEAEEASEKWWNQTKAFYDGKISEKELEAAVYHFNGLIKDQEEFIPTSLFEKNANFQALSEKDQKSFRNVVIEGYSKSDEWIYFLFFLGLTLSCLWLFLSFALPAFTMKGDKELMDFINTQNNKDYAMEKIKTFFNHNQIEDDFWISNQYFTGFKDGKVVFGDTSQIVWIYEIQSDVVSGDIISSAALFATRNIAPAQMMIIMKNGQTKVVTINKGPAARERLMNYIFNTYPWIVVGTNDELENLYKQDRETFLNLKYYNGFNEDPYDPPNVS